MIRPDLLASDAEAAHALKARVEMPAPVFATGVAVGATPSRYKVFLNGAQQGPYSQEELALRVARAEVDPSTRVWNMQWNPKADKWRSAGDMPELAAMFDHAIPDPDNDVPDPE